MIRKIGIAIIIVTFLVSLNPYLLMFTLPAFLIGIVLLWTNRHCIKANVLWTVLPVILCYPAFLAFMYVTSSIRTQSAQKLDFIFPSGFKGKAIVIDNCKCGQPIKLNGDREQLIIPKNGILLYQGEIETGLVSHKYYELGQNELLELPARANYMYIEAKKDNPSTIEKGVWLEGSGSTTSLEPKPRIEYTFLSLTVSQKDSLDRYFDFHYNKRFEKLADSLVRDCIIK